MKPGQVSKFDIAKAKSLEGRVWDSIERGNLKQALADCKRLNETYPDFDSAWHTASHLAMKLNNPAVALTAIERALSIESDSAEWLLQKGICLTALGRLDEVNNVVEQLRSRPLRSDYQYASLGMLLTRLGRREQAVEYYSRAAELKPNVARHHYNIASLQRTLGDIEAAEKNFDKAIALNPSDYEAWKIRSELRRQTPEDNHVASLEQQIAAGIDDPRGRAHICYALAKELEDLGDASRSFSYLKMGADARRGLMQYDVQRDLDTMEAIRQTYGRDMVASRTEGSDNPEAIFILGMPRTGTTLVERILSSHTEVFAAGELNNFAAQMMALVKPLAEGRSQSRDDLVRLSAGVDFKRLGEEYISSTRPLTGHTARFIDKLPLNYLYVGLIHRALPNAKIISLRRNPLDTCYAVYKQLFLDAYPFSYDLAELAHYYVAYHRLMEHWHTVLPGVVHTVSYETLVENLNEETRKLLSHCDLEWQPQCLKFHENREASTTASTVQVRQPVYRTSVGRWRDYSEQLKPVIDILRDAGIHTNDQERD
jgi:Tfp pilus assembly protein PilF